jgi:prepilin-type N-terminal cleavage/methylation domain-containing protein
MTHAKRTTNNELLTTNKRRGFTLVELMAVIIIIAILLGFVFAAALDAQRTAQVQATQALIQKLDTALSDRLDALLQNAPTPSVAHGYMGAIYSSLAASPGNPLGMMPSTVAQAQATLRAQVIATFDYIKSEVPDVFFIDPNFYAAGASYTGPYPFNFAAVPYAGTTNLVNNSAFPILANVAPVILPLGNSIDNNSPNSFGNLSLANFSATNLSGTGIYGASYTAAAGLNKNLGYQPFGYDGIDNTGEGLIDEWAEGIGNNPQVPTPDNPSIPISLSQLITTRLANHKHNTARAEVLYALLVEGSGPLGSAFTRDDFSDKEVQDTDGDGLPEFVDAWGKPLQFFRWPVLYHSDFQRGQILVSAGSSAAGAQGWNAQYPYGSTYDQREQDALDPNQQLMGPAWWSNAGVGGLAANNGYSAAAFVQAPSPPMPPVPNGASGGTQTFGAFFHRLFEPMPVPQQQQFGMVWDRGGSLRRAFFSKFLILSGGLDGVPGVFLYPDSALQGNTPAPTAALHLIANENVAMQFGLDLVDFTISTTIPNQTPTISGISSSDPTNPNSVDIQNAGQDDITNHSVQSAGGVGGPGT